MHCSWPFFRAMLSNLDMVLAKTDLGIGERYAELASNGSAFFPRISDEWNKAREQLSGARHPPHDQRHRRGLAQ